MRRKSKKTLAVLLSATMALGSTTPLHAQEVVTEATTEVSSEAVTEAATETSSETVTEPVTETPSETVTEAATEAPSEIVTEAATETPSETATEAATEPVSETITESATEAVSETVTEALSEEATEPVSEAVTESACDTVPETEPIEEVPNEAKIQDVKAISSAEPDTESVKESDTDGATRPVDSSTTLADGVYKADAFTVTGGSGKTSFECTKITVSGGQAAATIVIGSDKYTYVKANGQKYNTVAGSGTATVTFPVDLNKENPIIGYTTSMGGKEIAYSILISLAEDTAAATTDVPDSVSASEEDSSAFTKAVDNSTTLKDAVYTPDAFTGGKADGTSSKTTITCSKVTIKDGKAYATITFSSNKYTYIKANGYKYMGICDDIEETSTFVIPVDLNVDNTIIGYTSKMGKEIDYVINITLPEEGDNETESTESESETSSDNGTSSSYGDGDYNCTVDSGFKMFNIVSSSAKVNNGKIMVYISTSSASYDRIYLGSKDDTEKLPIIYGTANSEGGFDFAFEISENMLGSSMNYVPGKPDGTWYTGNQRQLTFSGTLEKAEQESESESESETGAETVKKEDGNYSIDVESSAAMFKVVEAIVKARGGVYTAEITLSGTGYDLLYMGTKEDAAKADAASKIGYTTNKEGKYVFTIPVSALDTPIAVAAHSVKNDTWYDRTLTFQSEGMTLISEGESESESKTETESETEKPVKKPEKESSSVKDLSGSTSAVNSSTALADGVYTPDKFSWSGGSGRVGISCNQITVSGGQAYATIVFSSSNYSYVKANGRQYTGSVSGGTTSFTIPVQLNANNTIIGMTTAMSAAHEITYNIYVYLAAADKAAAENANGANSEQNVPEIVGLTYQSETKLEHAQLIHIYNYEDDITLIEIDMSADVEWAEDQKAESADEETSVLEETDEDAPVQTKEELMAELYKEDSVKYLVVPEGVETPVGLEKEMILVNLPVESAYVAENGTLDILYGLEQLDKISSVGFTAEECDLEEVKVKLEDESISLAGNIDELDFRTLLLSGCDLALFSSEVLPKDIQDAEEFTERYEQISSGFATLGVPMFVDRSADEKTEEAKAEWTKLYEILFECGETDEK